MQILADPVHATSVPVSSSELCLSNLEHLAFLVSSIHLDFRCFLPHLLQGSGFDRGISFAYECSKVSLSLLKVWLCISVFVPIYCNRKFH